MLLGEANIVPRDDADYFAGGDGLHMIFNFWVNQHVFPRSRPATRAVAAALRSTAGIPEDGLGFLLRNHDELDLGRLTPGRRQVFASSAPSPRCSSTTGASGRLAPMLGSLALELAYSLLFSLPGATVLRYGEEIGTRNLRLKERNAIRTPMQWSSGRNGGFSDADRLVRPPIAGGRYGYESVNVEDQLRDPNSLLRWLIELIRVRKQAPEVGAGSWSVLPTSDPSVLALRYRLDGSTVVTVHNFADRPSGATIELPGRLSSMFDDEISTPTRGKHRVQLEAFGYRWYRAR